MGKNVLPSSAMLSIRMSTRRRRGCRHQATFKKYGQVRESRSFNFLIKPRSVQPPSSCSMYGTLVVHGGAVSDDDRASDSPEFRSWEVWIAFRGRVAACVRRARILRAHRKPACRCTRTGSCRPFISPRFSLGSKLDLPNAPRLHRRRKTIDFIREINEVDPEFAALFPPMTPRSRCRRKLRRSSTSARNPRRPRSLRRRRPGHRRLWPPLPAGAPHGGEGRPLRVRGFGRGRGGYGMGPHSDIETNHIKMASIDG